MVSVPLIVVPYIGCNLFIVILLFVVMSCGQKLPPTLGLALLGLDEFNSAVVLLSPFVSADETLFIFCFIFKILVINYTFVPSLTL
jgi:hypothetical protein